MDEQAFQIKLNDMMKEIATLPTSERDKLEKMAGKIPNSKYVNLSGTGHMAPVENADGFNTHLIDFLNTLD